MCTQEEEDNRRRQCQVVIVGAGAAGLQCARLLQDDAGIENVIVLEARDRIGGRIHSVPYKRNVVDGKDTSAVDFVVDHGAAWVHGTGYDWPADPKRAMHGASEKAASIPEPNPMMDLLAQATGKELYSKHLKPVCRRGNPWMRPKHVLHDMNEILNRYICLYN